MDHVTTVIYCKATDTINMSSDPTLLDERDSILLLNFPNLWTLICAKENRPFLLEYSPYMGEHSFVNVLFQPHHITLPRPCQNARAM